MDATRRLAAPAQGRLLDGTAPGIAETAGLAMEGARATTVVFVMTVESASRIAAVRAHVHRGATAPAPALETTVVTAIGAMKAAVLAPLAHRPHLPQTASATA